MGLIDVLTPRTPPEPKGARVVKLQAAEPEVIEAKPEGEPLTERILAELAQGPACMSEIVAALGLHWHIVAATIANLKKKGRIEVCGQFQRTRGVALLYRATGKPARKVGRQKAKA